MARDRNNRLIQKYGGDVVPFAELPDLHALAFIHYMALDGEAWEMSPNLEELLNSAPSEKALKAALRKALPWYREAYGDTPVGVVNIPTEALTEAVLWDPDIQGKFDSFDEYHKWFKEIVGVPRHRRETLWPVILSSDNSETLQDGWHRMHRYYALDISKIPALFYP